VLEHKNIGVRCTEFFDAIPSEEILRMTSELGDAHLAKANTGFATEGIFPTGLHPARNFSRIQPDYAHLRKNAARCRIIA
jgi:hypothetical protein